MQDEINESVERLFEEQFIPPWQKEIDKETREVLDYNTARGIKKAWQEAAKQSRQRISEKYKTNKDARPPYVSEVQ